MKKITYLLLSLILLMHGVAFAGSINTINFATEATYPPFEYVNESGSITGFDVEVAKAICNEIKATCTFSNQAFNGLMPSLKLGKFDALIAAIGVTAERKQQVDFSDSYYEPSAVFVAETNKKYRITDMVGKTIGVQQGSTFEKYLSDTFQNKITAKTYASIQDAFLDLIAGRVDAVIADTPIAASWLKQDNNNARYTVVEKPIVDKEHFGAGYAIAIRKGNNELLAVINRALTTIKSNGIYNQIAKKYFGG